MILAALLVLPALAGVLALAQPRIMARSATLAATALVHLGLVVASWRRMPRVSGEAGSPWMPWAWWCSRCSVSPSPRSRVTPSATCGSGAARRPRLHRLPAPPAGGRHSGLCEPASGAAVGGDGSGDSLGRSADLSRAGSPARSRRCGNTWCSPRWASRSRCSAPSSLATAQPSGTPLLFGDLLQGASSLHTGWLQAAFVFLLLGYGLKMGLGSAPHLEAGHLRRGAEPGRCADGRGVTGCAFLGLAPSSPSASGPASRRSCSRC